MAAEFKTEPVVTASHSPLPWFVQTEDRDQLPAYEIVDAEKASVATIDLWHEHRKGNSALIVKCVNERPRLLAEREELLAALKELAYYAGADECDEAFCDPMCACCIAMAAIAKAEGRQP